MDKASHLSVILDLSPTQWQLSAQANNAHPLTLSSFISQLLAFLNAHMACKDENSLAVFGALPGKSVMLYSTTTPVDEKAVTADANTYRPFKILDSTITQNILEQIDSISDTDVEAPIDFVGALTKSLCYINRVTNPANSRSEDALILPDPRILIISVSPDQSSSYISVMNSIFSAQKLKVTIDVCKLHGADSVFLQQAAHLTGGSYISIERPDALLQFLMMSFLPPPSIRQLISVPTQDKIDFRAACFCHKNIVDIGFVCSVCLSIFCQPVPVCSTCQTKFPMKTLLRLKAAQPNAPHPPPSRATTPATPSNSLPRSTSIAPRGTPTSGAPRGAHASTSNGNANALPVARNTPRA